MRARSMKKSSRRSTTAPLHGIKVLDLTRVLAGPYCTMKLGDMGANVIKVEQPGRGDDTRGWGPPFIHGESAYFLSINRNKRSIALDLKSPDGKAILTKLIRRCDVLVENFRPGIFAGLGFSKKKLASFNKKMIVCTISGYGKSSSRKNDPSYELIVQGESGLMDLTGSPFGSPMKTGISLSDVTAGNLAFEGILLGLYRRERTGMGSTIH